MEDSMGSHTAGPRDAGDSEAADDAMDWNSLEELVVAAERLARVGAYAGALQALGPVYAAVCVTAPADVELWRWELRVRVLCVLRDVCMERGQIGAWGMSALEAAHRAGALLHAATRAGVDARRVLAVSVVLAAQEAQSAAVEGVGWPDARRRAEAVIKDAWACGAISADALEHACVRVEVANVHALIRGSASAHEVADATNGVLRRTKPCADGGEPMPRVLLLRARCRACWWTGQPHAALAALNSLQEAATHAQALALEVARGVPALLRTVGEVEVHALDGAQDASMEMEYTRCGDGKDRLVVNALSVATVVATMMNAMHMVRIGRGAEAEEMFGSARDLAHVSLWTRSEAEALMGEFHCAEARKDRARARECCRDAGQLVGIYFADNLLLAEVWLCRFAEARMMEDKHEMRFAADMALRVAEEGGNMRCTVEARLCKVVARWRAEHRAPVDASGMRDLVHLAARHGTVALEVRAMRLLAMVLVEHGDTIGARDVLREALLKSLVWTADMDVRVPAETRVLAYSEKLASLVGEGAVAAQWAEHAADIRGELHHAAQRHEPLHMAVSASLVALLLGDLAARSSDLGDPGVALQLHALALYLSLKQSQIGSISCDCAALAIQLMDLGRYEESARFAKRSLALCVQTGSRRGEANALGSLGCVHQLMGEFNAAIEYHRRDLAIAIELDDRPGQGSALGNLGATYERLRDYDNAIKYHVAEYDIAMQLGDVMAEANAQGGLGCALLGLGRFAEAAPHHLRQLELAERMGMPTMQAKALGNLGTIYQSLGDMHRALEYTRRDVAICEEISDLAGVTSASFNLANVLRGLGQQEEALVPLRRSLDVARQLGDTDGECTALSELAHIKRDLGMLDEAIALWREVVETAAAESDRGGEDAFTATMHMLRASRPLVHLLQRKQRWGEVGKMAAFFAHTKTLAARMCDRRQASAPFENDVAAHSSE